MGRGQRINELIDNDRFQRNPSMTLTMKIKYGVRDAKLEEKLVDERADCIVNVFASPNSKPLYCDAVRSLTKAFLDEQIKIAMSHGRSQVRLFNYLIYKKLRSIGLYAK